MTSIVPPAPPPADDEVSDRDTSATAAPTDRLFVGALLVAAVARTTLPEATSAGFIAANLCFVAATITVALGWARTGFGVGLLALALPVAMGWDWLSQTVLLASVSVAGLLGGVHGARTAARWLAPALYAVAAWHKWNRGWLDPDVSCAVHGMARLLDRLPALELLRPLAPAMPTVVSALEVAIATALLARWSRAPALAAAFHVPLTLALAPVFAFSALPLWAAALRPRDAGRWITVATSAHTRRWLIGVALFAFVVFVALGMSTFSDGGALRRTLDSAKAAALTALAVGGVLLSRSTTAPPPPTPRPNSLRRTGWARRVGAAVAAAWVVWCMQPYLGFRMQHTGAMLSNLRIDDGCWNHVVVPERVRRVEPYLRIERVTFERPDALRSADRLTTTIRSTLWHPAQLHTMRRNWCTERVGSIELAGTWRGAAWHLPDLCAASAELPVPVGPFGQGWGVAPRMLRFQKNLPRACPVACVH